VITPAYSPTATERVLPRLALDFTTGALDARVAVARALNTATAVNSSGYIATVNANLPRFDYDPVTLACKGLLIEETRANLIPQSNDFSTWGNVFAGLTTGQGPAPDGLNSGTKVTPNNGQVSSWISQVGIPASTGTYTLTVYAKAAGLTAFQIGFFNATDGDKFAVYTLSGSGVVASSSVGTTASIQNAGNGWYRCILTFTTTGTGSTQVQVARLSSGTGDGVNGWLVYGAQLEAGAFATSYIPTAGTSLTRNADVVSMTGTNFSSWYNASEGTISVLVSDLKNTAAAALASLDFSNTNRMTLNAVGGDVLFAVRREAALQANISCGAYTSGQYQIVGAYKNNNFAAAANGNATTTDASGTIPTAIKLSIGSYNTGNLTMTGYIKKLAYYPQRLVDNEVQAFSKG
jgi:hypothetical protein